MTLPVEKIANIGKDAITEVLTENRELVTTLFEYDSIHSYVTGKQFNRCYHIVMPYSSHSKYGQ